MKQEDIYKIADYVEKHGQTDGINLLIYIKPIPMGNGMEGINVTYDGYAGPQVYCVNDSGNRTRTEFVSVNKVFKSYEDFLEYAEEGFNYDIISEVAEEYRTVQDNLIDTVNNVMREYGRAIPITDYEYPVFTKMYGENFPFIPVSVEYDSELGETFLKVEGDNNYKISSLLPEDVASLFEHIAFKMKSN